MIVCLKALKKKQFVKNKAADEHPQEVKKEVAKHDENEEKSSNREWISAFSKVVVIHFILSFL